MKRALMLLTALLILFTLTACYPGDGKHDAENTAGFWWGLWHGFIAIVTLIWGLFNHSVKIYEVHNSGWWYDLGFLLPLLGGFSIGVHKRKSKREKE